MEEYFMNRNKEARILGHLETMALQIVEYLHQFVFAMLVVAEKQIQSI